jgi:hypothetical protein
MNVSTEDAVNGTTSEDILNEDGGLVLPAGVCLSQALVNALINQNINKVNVTFDENTEAFTGAEPAQSTETSKVDAEFKAYVDYLFIRHRGPFMKEFQQCLLQIKK